jgi:hypothetical protein
MSRFRLNIFPALIMISLTIGFAFAAEPDSSIESYFSGKEVVLKIDMPGTQKGVDLRFNKTPPMNWKEYSSRLKEFGPAIRKGDVARITSIVVKKDTIEFQLDGGGFGTFGDDTKTTVDAKSVDKSDYEKSLENQIANSTDDDEKRRLQRDLDRERARRERQQGANQRDAQIASQMKSQQVSDNRMRGGSRFNLRWDKSIPPDQLNPQAVMARLADYVEFNDWRSNSAAVPAQSTPAPATAVVPADSGAPADSSGSPTANLKRGMKMDEVTNLLGAGKKISESAGADGLKTEVYQYAVEDRSAEVTYVDGIVVRFSISSK